MKVQVVSIAARACAPMKKLGALLVERPTLTLVVTSSLILVLGCVGGGWRRKRCRIPAKLVNNEESQRLLRQRRRYDIMIRPFIELWWRIGRFLRVGSVNSFPEMYIANRRTQITAAYDDQSIQVGVRIEVEIVANVRCFIFTPLKSHTGRDLLPTCLFFYHGGGYCVGSTHQTYFQFLQSLCKKLSITVISPEYRLAPEHPFPAGFDDCYNSTEELIKRYSLKHYILTGDSAGGNLCTAVALKLAEESSKNDDDFGKAGILAPIYPHFQASCKTLSMIEEDIPSLTRDAMAKYIALTYTGTFTKALVADILEDRHLSLINVEEQDSEDEAIIIPEKGRARMKERDEKILERLKSCLNNKHTNPLLRDDTELDTLMQFCQKGIYVMVCEHDILRDDGLIFMERLENINSTHTKKCNLNTWVLKEGFHGFIKNCQYGKPSIERNEIDDILDTWCDTIVTMVTA